MSHDKQERHLVALAHRTAPALLLAAVEGTRTVHDDAQSDALLFTLRNLSAGQSIGEAVAKGTALAVKRYRERLARSAEVAADPSLLAELHADTDASSAPETPGMTHDEAWESLSGKDRARLAAVVDRGRLSVQAVARATAEPLPRHKAASDALRVAVCDSFAAYSVARHPLSRRGVERSRERVSLAAFRWITRERGVAGMAVWQQGITPAPGVDISRVPFTAPAAPLSRSLPDPLRDGSPARGAAPDVAPRIGMTAAGSSFERGDRERSRERNRKEESNEAAASAYADRVERNGLCDRATYRIPYREPVCRCGAAVTVGTDALTLVMLPDGKTAWRHALKPCPIPLERDGVLRCGCSGKRGTLSPAGEHRPLRRASKSDR